MDKDAQLRWHETRKVQVKNVEQMPFKNVEQMPEFEILLCDHDIKGI